MGTHMCVFSIKYAYFPMGLSVEEIRVLRNSAYLGATASMGEVKQGGWRSKMSNGFTITPREP